MLKDDSSSLAKSAARGGVQTLIGQVLRTVLQLASLVVLARVLSPHEYGLAAMVLSIAAIASMLSDFGLSFAAMQAKSISVAERNNLFWLNAALGSSIGLLVFFGSPLIAMFYSQEELEDVAKFLSISFILAGATAQYRADHLRRLMFGRVVLMDIGSQVAYFAVALTVALLGGGHWSLVAASVMASATMLVAMIISAGWIPGLPQWRTPIVRFVKYGAGTLLTQLINNLSANVNPIAIGRLITPAAVGIYSRGFQVFSISIQQITTPLTAVAVPVLSRLQDQPVKFLSYAKQAQSVLCYILGMSLCLVAVGGEPLVNTVLGPGWSQAGTIIQLLAIGGIFQIAGNVNYWIFLSRAEMPTFLLCDGVARLLFVPLVFVATGYGLELSAIAYSVGLILVWCSCTFIGLPRIGISPTDLLKSGVLPLSAYVFIYVVAASLRELVYTPHFGDAESLFMSWGTLLLMVLSMLVLPRVRADLAGIMLLARSARNKAA
nr:lipopolysaccharide biosynthesis protein [Kocuria rosea]